MLELSRQRAQPVCVHSFSLLLELNVVVHQSQAAEHPTGCQQGFKRRFATIK